MSEAGVEPAHPFGHWRLKPAWLPSYITRPFRAPGEIRTPTAMTTTSTSSWRDYHSTTGAFPSCGLPGTIRGYAGFKPAPSPFAARPRTGAGADPASTAYKAAALTVVLSRLGDACGNRTRVTTVTGWRRSTRPRHQFVRPAGVEPAIPASEARSRCRRRPRARAGDRTRNGWLRRPACGPPPRAWP